MILKNLQKDKYYLYIIFVNKFVVFATPNF